MKQYYLDAAASTPVHADVLKVMLPYFSHEYGNPSSAHSMGERARKAIDDARKRIAQELKAKSSEIIFTSGVTESNMLVLRGLAQSFPKKKSIVISAIEHASITEPARALEKEGYAIIRIPVSRQGIIDLKELELVLKKRRDILVVSMMHGNNVIGSVQDSETMGTLCSRYNVLFHTDAAQTFGNYSFDVRRMHIDLLSASAHKIGGPKGVGMLFIREGITLKPLIYGGGQERDLRGGTENVPAIVGFAKALDCKKDMLRIKKSRDSLARELEKLGGVSHYSLEGLPHLIHVSFPVSAQTLVAFLSHVGIYVATGSACESKREKEDHVLQAIGLTSREINGSVRISLFESLSEKEIHYISSQFKKALATISAP